MAAGHRLGYVGGEGSPVVMASHLGRVGAEPIFKPHLADSFLRAG